jgi:Uma2 family endonuclease
MSTTATEKLMTTEELLAIPDDGVERWLIRGKLHEKYPEIIGGTPMTFRNRFHSKTMANVATVIRMWLANQPNSGGEVLCGEAGIRLRGDPATTVGVDVAYISAEVAAHQTDETTLVDGVPLLAVEILSPSDTQEEIHDKIKTYINSGVALVWIVDPNDRTVRVYRRGAPPELFNADQELTAEPHLPGFRVPVARLFE